MINVLKIFFKSTKKVEKFYIYSITPYKSSEHFNEQEKYMSMFLKMPVEFKSYRDLGSISNIDCIEMIFEVLNADNLSINEIKKKLKVYFGNRNKYGSWGTSKAIINGKTYN